MAKKKDVPQEETDDLEVEQEAPPVEPEAPRAVDWHTEKRKLGDVPDLLA